MKELDEDDLRRALAKSVGSVNVDRLRGPRPALNAKRDRSRNLRRRWVPLAAAAVVIAAMVMVFNHLVPRPGIADHASDQNGGSGRSAASMSQISATSSLVPRSSITGNSPPFAGVYCGQTVERLALLSSVRLEYKLTGESISIDAGDPGLPALGQHAYFVVVDDNSQVIAVGPTKRDVQRDQPLKSGVVLTLQYSPPVHNCDGSRIDTGEHRVVVIVEHVATSTFYRTETTSARFASSGWIIAGTT